MGIMTLIWSMIGIVSAIWLGTIMMFSAIGAIGYYISGTGRKKNTRKNA
ncbi:MAG: hypothetical protein V1729_06205 [Candidatus Woesearchaeota archaeon]